MSEKLLKQTTQRTVLIEQQKRIQTFYDLKKDTATLIEAKLRFNALQTQYSAFQAVQGAIEILDQAELVNSIRAEYEEKYFELFPKFQEIIDNLEDKDDKDDAASVHSQASLPPRVCHSQAVKLHRIEVKKFSGDLTKWMSFHESFMKLIHENKSLDNLTRFHYLRDALTGGAERVVESLELTSENYDEALNLLNDRFHNKKLICREHIRQLFDRPKMNKCSSESLREIIDFFNAHLRALTTLGRPTKQWNDLIVHLLYSKLDDNTRSKFDEDSSPNELPELDDMVKFLNRRSQTLEGMTVTPNVVLDIHKQQKKSNSRTSSQRTSLLTNSHQKYQCVFCQKTNHLIHKCYTFLKKNIADRYKEALRLNLCFNCLNTGHPTNHCPSEKRCKKCNEQHHTMLHQENSPSTTHMIETTQSLESQRKNQSPPSISQPQQHASALTSSQPVSHTSLSSSIDSSNGEPHSSTSNKCTVFLQTALVYLFNSSGVPVLCRAVLDSASHLHFITEHLVNQLGLKRFQHCTPISGIGNTITSAKGSTLLTMKSRTTAYEVIFEAEIMPKITNLQPQKYCNVQGWNIPRNINLADPQFNSPQRIDLLIGAELYLQLLSVGQILLADGLPTLQNTVLGWVVSGKDCQSLEPIRETNNSCLMSCTAQEELTHIVERFWKLEEVNTSNVNYSCEEEACEVHFRNHVHRDNSGRYIVSLPLKQPANMLANSYHMANKRFMLLEKRLSRNSELRNSYVDFMAKYEQLGHMSPVSENQIAKTHYYLPHHCVSKIEGGTSKIRVVFDASAPTSNGKSLNSIMMVGPVVQNDLVSILIRFRLHKYVFSTDISKMYRQIKVDDNDSHRQYILWRNNEESPVQTFRLNTVTYGTSAAPFLATRCLKQLALDEQLNYPMASNMLIHDTYVDDILSGSNSLEIAQRMKEEIIDILKSAGMTLGKWCANHETLLKDVPTEDRQKLFKIDDGDFTKTLGLYWSPQGDDFRFMVSVPEKSRRITKRSVTSDIARIFDPLGLCGPVIVLGKQFMQQLWKLNLDWDEALPQNLHTSWQTFQEELGLLNNLRIKRHINPACDSNNFQLHGFADASERAYGACLYLRTTNNCDETFVQLICSRSRVAPVNNISLPRLELCAALLLSELVSSVLKIIGIDFDSIHYWTDSQIVLSWIQATSSTWKTFVANRVATIQSLSQISQWHHVSSSSNPADLISRGLHPQRFVDSIIWFHGPSFLQTNESSWPINTVTSDITIPERKIQKDVLTSSTAYNDLLDNCKFQNSFIKFRNTYAYVLRFIHNKFIAKEKNQRRTGHLSNIECQMSINAIVKIVQFNHFAEEIQCLLAGKEVQGKSKLKSLHPFLDNGIIRVGGRLSNSALPYSTKYPVILPSGHNFTISMATHLHLKSFHTGPNTLLALIRSEYWPLNGRHLVRNIIRSCVSCFKTRPITGEQLMADLPSKRVNVAAPFQNVGIDLCGPFYVKYRIRGKTPTKAYLVVFVCFVVKAIHIEAVTELTTASFIGAFKRFISTRGLCANVYTDNATNFVGTNSELKELQQLFQSKQHEEAIIKMCQEDNINWHFAPPASPHFGGLYEAAVKSAKHHLRRIVANAALTMEELMTVAKQVEAVLNSRPLSAMSSDPSDLQAITPGHFLIGRPLTSIVEPNIEKEVVPPLKRWRFVQQIHQHFWTRWSTEYLTEMQHRRTWTNVKQNIALNQLVLMKDENLPPLKWKLGRIVKIHPGADGLTRVVDVRTAFGTYTRSITKICPLPISNDDQLTETTQPPQCD